MFIPRLKPLALAAAIVASAGLMAEARAATLIIDGFGQLTGAEGVDVNGTLYDVTFADGTCTALFNGCDEEADFTFNSGAVAADAAQALLDQVFVDVGFGEFDSAPSLTNGCNVDANCNAFIPYGFAGDFISIASAQNNPMADIDTVKPSLAAGPDNDFAFNIYVTYALFSAAGPDLPGDNPDTPGADVPAPSALLLFAIGLAGLATAGRSRRNRG